MISGSEINTMGLDASVNFHFELSGEVCGHLSVGSWMFGTCFCVVSWLHAQVFVVIANLTAISHMYFNTLTLACSYLLKK